MSTPAHRRDNPKLRGGTVEREREGALKDTAIEPGGERCATRSMVKSLTGRVVPRDEGGQYAAWTSPVLQIFKDKAD